MTDYKKFLDEGIAEIHKGSFEKGIEKINQSIDLKNDWEIPYFYRAVAYHSLEKYDEAMLDYSKSIQLNEKMTDAYYNRARISLTRKDIQNPDIKKAVEAGAKTVDDIKEATEAGTICCGCDAEIEEALNEIL